MDYAANALHPQFRGGALGLPEKKKEVPGVPVLGRRRKKVHVNAPWQITKESRTLIAAECEVHKEETSMCWRVRKK